MSQLLGTRDLYGETLAELGTINPNIVVLDADLSGSTKTCIFAKKFPERFFNMGVSEQDMMGTAAGLASSGKIPFASTFAIFAAGRAWEQIRYSIAYNKLNVKIVASHGGVTVGEDGGSHQCVEDIALMRVIPGMTVIVPADGIETKKVIVAVSKHKGPVYVRVSRIKFPVIFDDGYAFKIGKGKIVAEGSDVSIIASGLMVSRGMEAANQLKKEGISARVINMSTIKPIDEALILDSARKTGAIITAEEHSTIGGLGSAVAEVVGEGCPVPIKRVGVEDKFGFSGKAEELLSHFGLTAEKVVCAAREVLKRKQP